MDTSTAALAKTSPEVDAPIIPFPTGRFAIPVADSDAFGDLKPREQARILLLLKCFAAMEAGSIVNTSKRLGFELRHVGGFSETNLRKCYYDWLRAGWKGLRRNFRGKNDPLPEEFKEFFRALAEQNGRSVRQAMNLLHRKWATGEHVPGFGTWTEWYLTNFPDRDLPTACTETPTGWQKSNLYAIAPTRAQRALKTQGFAAAKAHLPSLVRDTSKLLPLQLIAIDDFEIDQMCFFHDPATGVRAICKMVGIAAMDVATREIKGLVLKPRLEDDAGKNKSITRAEVRLLLFNLLRDHGVPQHGMTILAENAAAAVTTELELTFINLFGGKVAVTRTGMIADKVLANGFLERGGKPWLKGWIESGFNLMANIAATLPGQKGASYVTKPGDFEEKRRIAERLIGTGPQDANLSDEQLSRARVPFKSPAELCDAYMEIFSIMAHRTNHKMLGFEKVIEWREHDGDEWQPWEALASLSEAQQQRVQLRDRMQSPRERWNALWPRVTCDKIPEHVLMMLLLTPKKAKLDGHKATFTHNGAGFTWIIDPRSRIAKERKGSELLFYFDPANPDHAHVCRLDGQPLGEVKRLGKVDITDTQAVTDAERQLAQLYGAVLSSVRARPLHQLADQQAAEDAQVNAALITEAKELRNTAGITATLNRPVPSHAGATTAAGDDTARHIVTADQEKRASKAAARALQDVDLDTSDLI